MYMSLILFYDTICLIFHTCATKHVINIISAWWASGLNSLAGRFSSVRESHTCFFPPALRAPKMPVFHPVDFAAFLAFASDFSMSVMVPMCLDSCRGARLAACLGSRRVRELTDRLDVPVETWMLERTVCWRSRNSWFGPRTFYHIKM